MVRPAVAPLPVTWEEMPIPFLVVEILSSTTRRRDHEQKRAFYLRNGVAEYWIVDGEQRTIRVITANADDVLADKQLTWNPSGAGTALVIEVQQYFRDAVGNSERAPAAVAGKGSRFSFALLCDMHTLEYTCYAFCRRGIAPVILRFAQGVSLQFEHCLLYNSHRGGSRPGT